MIGIITLDIGTTSLRSILYDESACPGAPDQRANPPEHHADGRVEQDPACWQRLVPEILRSAALEAERRGLQVEGIALSSQRSSVIPVDAEGKALYPAIMWQDRRTLGLAESLKAQAGFVRERSGTPLSPVMSALKMLWLRREEPDVYARTHKFLGIHDFVLHLLTGRFATDPSLACRSNLLDIGTLGWSPELAGLFEVDLSKLCDLVPPGSIVGGLGADIAARTGLKAGIPVISAGGDQQCATLGLGLLAPGLSASNTGTGSYLAGFATRPAIDPAGRTTCSAGAKPGTYIIEAALPTSGSVLRWFRETVWTGPGNEEDPFASLVAEAEASGPGARGLLLLPNFAGSGTPRWDPSDKGLLWGLGLGTKRGDLARAILEGIAFALADGLEVVEEACGSIDSVAVAGGMSRAGLFNRIEADAFGRKVLCRRGGSEATSLGAFMAGAVAIGLDAGYEEAFSRATAGLEAELYEPRPELTELYAGLRAKCRSLRDAAALMSGEGTA